MHDYKQQQKLNKSNTNDTENNITKEKSNNLNSGENKKR